MKAKKTYNAPLVSVTKIESEDIIMASGTLGTAKFNGATIESSKVYDIQ